MSKVVLFVKSAKTVTGEHTEHVRRENYGPGVDFKIVDYDFVLSEDQRRIVDLVKDLCRRHLISVEIVDVGRENILHTAIREERKKIEGFPALLADSGEKIEGNITREQAESFLSQIADRARKKYL